MSSSGPTAVTYIGLPISSGGAHSLGRMSLRVAYERTTQFLSQCTEPITPLEHTFSLVEVPQLRPDTQLEHLLRRRFGRGKNVTVPHERVDEALRFLEEIDPQPANRWGMAPLWLRAECTFRVRDPETGSALPGQDSDRYGGFEYEWRIALGTSRLALNLSNRASLGIDLCLPDADDETLARLIPWLQANLPCKLSAKHWKRWTPTKTGSFKAIKIAAPPTR
jgi:hypothetical protein